MQARILTSREQLGIRRRLRRAISVLTTLGFLGFTAYVLDVATTATGPAIDIAFDIAVYVAFVVHITRNWLDHRADRQQPAPNLAPPHLLRRSPHR